jgi:hypothetical protein
MEVLLRLDAPLDAMPCSGPEPLLLYLLLHKRAFMNSLVIQHSKEKLSLSDSIPSMSFRIVPKSVDIQD